MKAKALRRFGYLTGVAAGALLLAEACADSVSEMLIDAGTMLADAGMSMGSDAGTSTGSDAGANMGSDAGSILADAGSILADAGKILTDAGNMLVDAGMSIRDSGTDAGAQEASSPYKNGSRIKMRYTLQQGADGSQYATGPQPFDTLLNVDCSPLLATDGKTRCLPSGPSVGSYYADAACTQLLVNTYSCAPPPRYARMLNYFGPAPNTCPPTAGYRIYSVGAVYTGSVYQMLPPSACQGPLPSSSSNTMYYSATEMPPTSLVEFTPSGSADL